MAINPEIALGIRRQPLESPINKMAQVLQLQGMRDEAALRQAGMQRQNKLLELMGGAYEKPEMREEALLRGGFVKEANDLTKNRVDALKVQADTDKNRIDAAHKRVDSWGQAMGFVRQNPTLENAQAAVQHLVTMGVMPQEMAQSAVASLQADPSPQGVARFADMGFRAALAAKDQLPKIEVRDIGGQTITQSADPLTGRTAITGAVQNTQSPDAILQAQTSEANNRRSVGAQMANAAATREIANATRDAARIQSQFKSEQGLREEFAGLPEVKRYKAAYPSYAAIVKAAQTNNPQADINLVYGLAKLYDPDSVVREGEYATIANSQAIPEWLKGTAQRLAGGGRLTAETKRQVLEQAQGRILTFQDEYDKARGAYEQIGRGQGFDPNRLFTPVGEPVTLTVDLDSLPSGGRPQGGSKPRVLQWGK
jgi:hypothetical protein